MDFCLLGLTVASTLASAYSKSFECSPLAFPERKETPVSPNQQNLWVAQGRHGTALLAQAGHSLAPFHGQVLVKTLTSQITPRGRSVQRTLQGAPGQESRLRLSHDAAA